jgi:uncharacterized protein YukJ
MPIGNYRLLVGVPRDTALDDDENPHIEVLVEAAGTLHRIAVNARSQIPPHALLYQRRDPFEDPVTGELGALAPGLTDLRNDRPDLALDYVRGGRVDRAAMQVVPFRQSGPRNDLREFLIPLLREAIDTGATICAFGETWGPDPGSDRYFGFEPRRGIHNIHMNQGSSGRFRGSNGPNQDGALMLRLGDPARWVALFFAFQSQSWNTDPATGDAVGDGPPRRPVDRSPQLDGVVAVVAALVNPVGGAEEGRETVTLLNRSDADVPLDGWTLADRIDRRTPLDGTIAAGGSRRIVLPGDATRLGNQGGEIILRDAEGTVVHRVEYDRGDLGPEGWTVLF